MTETPCPTYDTFDATYEATLWKPAYLLNFLHLRPYVSHYPQVRAQAQR
jgi:hypothetical protein